MAAKRKLLEPIHPGEILLEDFMKPLGISAIRVRTQFSLILEPAVF
jgi:plasmid maintenance system antidote protein VapI